MAASQRINYIVLRVLGVWSESTRQARPAWQDVSRPASKDACSLTENNAEELQGLLASLEGSTKKVCRKVESIEAHADEMSETHGPVCVSDVLQISGELCGLAASLRAIHKEAEDAARLSGYEALTDKSDHRDATPKKTLAGVARTSKGRMAPTPAKTLRFADTTEVADGMTALALLDYPLDQVEQAQGSVTTA